MKQRLFVDTDGYFVTVKHADDLNIRIKGMEEVPVTVHEVESIEMFAKEHPKEARFDINERMLKLDRPKPKDRPEKEEKDKNK